MWLLGALEDDDRPDLSGLIASGVRHNEWGLNVWVIEREAERDQVKLTPLTIEANTCFVPVAHLDLNPEPWCDAPVVWIDRGKA